ncbi:MAG: peptidase S41 [Candidatus Magasanikbacteria bacterium CG11_big_fil_rev_8_21_14_0_20_43_7]|uniref:Peptidase S41 n=1 Tax=Candidatus Magasanikbacteria bacterium CG11_big_fil_rev_8_21_14_0_20_43_7 TaxID=1974654 RepID=A0A2H0N2H0_9BACT|nr:MAG: peptidase S41 [Candidatus Magasanikbacteria bacterium CG11_big_fil_rev_8_21_14_0_20_43_7]
MNGYTHEQPVQTSWVKRIGWSLLFLVLFGSGVYVGSWYSVVDYISGDSGHVEISKVLDVYEKSRSTDVSFEQFWEVWGVIKTTYVEQPVKEPDMFYGAIQGLVAGLHDPYSTYFPPEEAKAFARDLAGEFEGIGAEIGLKDDQLIVVAPLIGSPAEQAGLKAGDKIFAIDGTDTFDMSLEEAVSHIRGKKGTIVLLTVSHDGLALEDVSVVRDTITIPTVTWDMKERSIAYIRLSYFNENTWSDFDTIVEDVIDDNVAGIILDMRMNPGGFLQTSIDVASEWIDQGVVVTERFADGKENIHRTRGKHRFAGIPTVVLVDEGTASGSEIVAGAIQDHLSGTIVGTQTFGKGSVQDFQIFSDGSALKLTIAKWFTPSDRAINGTGITPDVLLDTMFIVPTEEDQKVEIRDMGLEKAFEILQQ